MTSRQQQLLQIRKITDELLQSLSNSYDKETLNKINSLLKEISDSYSPRTPK